MLYQTKNPHGGDIYGGEIQLDFSANTNPFGTPEGILDAIEHALPEIHRYPDPYCRRLVQAISDFEGVPKEFILCGNGAAELIYSYCEAVRPTTAVELAPTFSEYALGLERLGCRVKRYFLRQENDFELDEAFLRFLIEEMPEVVFLCNPNNPTGQIIPSHLMDRILDTCREQGIRLFVDECFLDLSDAGESLKPLLGENPNLFLLKAFTKSYGMAGIRLGYCMSADSELLTKMAQTVQPWNVSSLAQAAGVAALREAEFLNRTRQLVFSERAWLKPQLKNLGFRVIPSHANYILFRGPAGLDKRLKEKQISIRNCGNYHGLDDGWYRIAVRLPEENKRLIQAMKEV